MPLDHGLGHAAWTRACNKDMDMQHGHGNGHAARTWTWTCSIDIDMQHGRGQCSMGMNMHQGHGHALWTWTCATGMDMYEGYGHAPCTLEYRNADTKLNLSLLVFCYFTTLSPASAFRHRVSRYRYSRISPLVPSYGFYRMYWKAHFGVAL